MKYAYPGIACLCLVLSSALTKRPQWLWVFSQVLESVAVLPQLLLLRQTTVPTVITSFYIVFLGSYRGLYLINWILRELDTNMRPPSAVSVIFGIVQTALYLDFAWVYWTRQRVKLRNGGVVDADDLRRGWLLRRIFGHKHFNQDGQMGDDGDEESAPALGRGVGGARRNNNNNNNGASRPKWGSRGISISADEGVFDHEDRGRASLDDDEEHGVTDAAVDPDAKMRDPDELARVLDEDEDLDAPYQATAKNQAAAPSSSSSSSSNNRSKGEPSSGVSGVRGGDEWDDD